MLITLSDDEIPFSECGQLCFYGCFFEIYKHVLILIIIVC